MCRFINRKPLHRDLLSKLGNNSFPCVFKLFGHQELPNLPLGLVKRNPPTADLRDALENRIATLYSYGTRDFSGPEGQHLRLPFGTHHGTFELMDPRSVSVGFGHMLLGQVFNGVPGTNPGDQLSTQRVGGAFLSGPSLVRLAFAFLKGKKQLSHPRPGRDIEFFPVVLITAPQISIAWVGNLVKGKITAGQIFSAGRTVQISLHAPTPSPLSQKFVFDQAIQCHASFGGDILSREPGMRNGSMKFLL